MSATQIAYDSGLTSCPYKWISARGVELADAVLGLGQPAARPARAVVDRADRARVGERLLVAGEQQVDHQPHDLARREVLARRLVAGLGEAPDELLEEVAHLEVGDATRAEVDLADARHHLVQQARALQARDLAVELELVDDRVGQRREGPQVDVQVDGQLRRVSQQLREAQRRRVVERLMRDAEQRALGVLHAFAP
jgi:hypothetical protein